MPSLRRRLKLGPPRAGEADPCPGALSVAGAAPCAGAAEAWPRGAGAYACQRHRAELTEHRARLPIVIAVTRGTTPPPGCCRPRAGRSHRRDEGVRVGQDANRGCKAASCATERGRGVLQEVRVSPRSSHGRPVHTAVCIGRPPRRTLRPARCVLLSLSSRCCGPDDRPDFPQMRDVGLHLSGLEVLPEELELCGDEKLTIRRACEQIIARCSSPLGARPRPSDALRKLPTRSGRLPTRSGARDFARLAATLRP